MAAGQLKKTKRTNLVRNPKRADYDRDAVNQIIDATSLCHVSYIIDGRPYVTPTLQWREGDTIYLRDHTLNGFRNQSCSTPQV